MTERQIRLFGDPVLKSESAQIAVIDDRIRSLVGDLLDSSRPPGRAGVAAPQIGVNLRAFSYNVNGTAGYLLNPELVDLMGEPMEIDEGCLSVPGLSFPTMRYPSARIRGSDIDGATVDLTASGLLAQVFQHECDHLNGMLYLDRLDNSRRREAMKIVRNSSWFSNGLTYATIEDRRSAASGV